VESPPRFRRRTIFIGTLLSVIAGIPLGIGFWHSSQTESRLRTLRKGDLTGLRVWGAGMRAGEGFCGCAIVPKPERVYYETKDPQEIRDFVDLLQPRSYLDLQLVEICGQVTIDFLKGDERVFWIHLAGRDLRSTKGILPVTSGSQDAIEEWLKQRSVREKIDAALMGRK
jgi:hypothetical protein